MPDYLIVFDTCGPYKAGDVAPGDRLGNVGYLLKVGAVVPAEPVPATESTTTTMVEPTTEPVSAPAPRRARKAG